MLTLFNHRTHGSHHGPMVRIIDPWFASETHDLHHRPMVRIRDPWFASETHDLHHRHMVRIIDTWFASETHGQCLFRIQISMDPHKDMPPGSGSVWTDAYMDPGGKKA